MVRRCGKFPGCQLSSPRVSTPEVGGEWITTHQHLTMTVQKGGGKVHVQCTVQPYTAHVLYMKLVGVSDQFETFNSLHHTVCTGVYTVSSRIQTGSQHTQRHLWMACLITCTMYTEITVHYWYITCTVLLKRSHNLLHCTVHTCTATHTCTYCTCTIVETHL